MSKYENLDRLHDLRAKGVLSEDEFQAEKAKVLAAVLHVPSTVTSSSAAGQARPWGMGVRTFCMLLHLSPFTGYLTLFAGFIVPIVMWVTCKDLDPRIDRHGRIVINWLISMIIYALVFLVLCLVLIGIPLLVALGVCAVVFSIVGAVKANAGVAWKYPLSIPFLSVSRPSAADR